LPIAKINLSKKSYFRGIFASAISAPLVSFLPGIGSAQAAMIGTKTIKQPNQKKMLFILGIINTIVMGLGIITFYSIGKTRNGSAVAISEILPNLNFSDIKLIIFTMIFVSIISFFLTLQISKIISKI
jgi:TctA family transporter